MSLVSWVPAQTIEEHFEAVSGAKSDFTTVTGNRPTAGSRFEEDLPRGKASFQYYSLATPNGQKPAILLEELGIDYDAHRIHIGKGEQFASGYVDLNPNSKIPAAIDYDTADGKPVRLWETASIMLYLADKHGRFMPKSAVHRAEVTNWLFWQVGGLGPMAGNFGHFFGSAAPVFALRARDYAVYRFGMELLRLCDVLENHLKSRTYMVNEEYSIADICCVTWARQARLGYIHKHKVKVPAAQLPAWKRIFSSDTGTVEEAGAAGEKGGNEMTVEEVTLKGGDFLNFDSKFPSVVAWIERIYARPAVQRGITVCGPSGATKPWLVEQPTVSSAAGSK